MTHSPPQPEIIFLMRGKPTYLGGLHELTSSNWSRMIKTAGTIRAGKPIETHDYHSMSQREQVGLFRGLYPGTLADAERVMDQHDFSTCSTLLDVGGGSGGLAITIAQANPDLKATVIDLPFVTPITRQFVEEAGAADRVEIITGNAVHDPLPGSYDVIVARHVVQVLSGDDSCILLDNLAAALSPGGVIFLVGWVLDDSRVTPANIVEYNLVLLTAYENGQAYSEQEVRSWLDQAGLVDFKRVVMSNGDSIVRARKPI